MAFYSFKKMRNKYPDAKIYMTIGEKSNGKTYAAKYEILLTEYIKDGKQCALIRRTDEDFKRGRGDKLWADMIVNQDGKEVLKELSKGKFNTIKFMVNGWYLGYKYTTINKKGEYIEAVEYEKEPFCYAFSVNNAEHTNGQSYLMVKNILFDEFTTKGRYLADEFTNYNILLSNIIRQRDDVTIYMCGNTIDKHCIYFRELGLYKVINMVQGEIDLYKFPTQDGRELQIAVEYCATSKNASKKSDIYFSFNNKNNTLKMIKDGSWDLNIYPHLKGRFIDANILQVFYVNYNDIWIKGHIYLYNDDIVLFYTPCSKPIITDETIIFTNNDLVRPLDMRSMTHGGSGKIIKIINRCLNYSKVYFATNETGDIIRKYMIDTR